MKLAERLDCNTYNDELAYYKLYHVYNWLQEENCDFVARLYPSAKRIRDEDISLWYSMETFNYTKRNPYTPNHYILHI